MQNLTVVDWNFCDAGEMEDYVDRFLTLYNELMLSSSQYKGSNEPITEINYFDLIDEEIPKWIRKKSKVYLYLNWNKELVAYTMLTPGEGNFGWISQLCVASKYRRRGYGTFVLKDAVKRVKQDHAFVYLSVYSENKSALSLYKKIGFQINSHTMFLE